MSKWSVLIHQVHENVTLIPRFKLREQGTYSEFYAHLGQMEGAEDFATRGRDGTFGTCVLLNAESTSRVSSFPTSLVLVLSDRWRIFYSTLSVRACALVLSTISHVLSKINMATSDSVLSAQPCGCSPKQII